MKSNLSNLVQQVNQIDAYAQETTEVLANAIVKSRNEATETKESLLTKISDADGEAKRATSAAKDAVVKADEVVRAGIDTVTKATEQAVSEVRKETEQSFKTQAEFNAAQAQAIQETRDLIENSKLADVTLVTDENFDGADLQDITAILYEANGLKPVAKNKTAVYFTNEKPQTIITPKGKEEVKQGYTVLFTTSQDLRIVPESVVVVKEYATDLAMEQAEAIAALGTPTNTADLARKILG